MKTAIKKNIKYVFAGLAALFIILMFTNLLNFENNSYVFQLTGWDIFAGKTIDGLNVASFEISASACLIFGILLLLIGVASCFFNFKKWNPIRNLALVFVSIFNMINAIDLKYDVLGNKNVGLDALYMTYTKVYYLFLAVAILLAVVAVIGLFIEENKAISFSLVKYVAAGALLVAILSLFIKSFVLDSRDQNVSINALNAISGLKFETKTFSVESLSKSLVALLNYCILLLALAAVLCDEFLTKINKKRFFGYIGVFATLFFVLYMIYVPYGALVFDSVSADVSFTFFGKATISCLVISLLLQIYTFLRDSTFGQAVKFCTPLLIVFALVIIYLPMLSVMAKSGTYEYNIGKNSYYTYELMFKLDKFQQSDVIYPAYLMVSYFAAIASLIVCFVPVKNTKIKYSVVCILSLVAILFALLVPYKMFTIVQDTTTYFLKFKTCIYIAFIALLLTAFSSFYVGFKFSDLETAKN